MGVAEKLLTLAQAADRSGCSVKKLAGDRRGDQAETIPSMLLRIAAVAAS